MSIRKRDGTNLESLMRMLSSKDGVVRLKARKSLVVAGAPAVPSLIQAMQKSPLDQVRWEAAKTLGSMQDPRSIPSLVKALDDSNSDVTWLAAEALRKFKTAAWPPLLRALIKSGLKSASLRQGAHHVLRNQNAAGFRSLLAMLTKALEPGADPGSTPLAAFEILKRLKANP